MEPDRRTGSVHSVLRVPAVSAFIVGSVIAVDPAGLWPFGPARWLVVSTCGVAVVALSLARPERRLDRPTSRLWLVLLACLTAGALTNHDLWIALAGTDTRHFGLATWLLCWAWRAELPQLP